MIDMILLSRN